MKQKSEYPHWSIDAREGLFRMEWYTKRFWGCSCRPMACGCRPCLLYPPSLFLLHDVNGRVLPSGAVILRIEVGPSIVPSGARETVRGRDGYDGREECEGEEVGDGFSSFGSAPVD